MTKEKSNSNAPKMQEGEMRLMQAYEIYSSLANGKIRDFNAVKEYLAEMLEQLLAEGKIGTSVVLASRIKSPESVVQNWKIGKDLNDVFGITLLTSTEEEMREIRDRLKKENKFNISSKKKMNEKRGYEAIHFLFDVGNADTKTKVECHMQTHEKYRNVYPHIFYKVRSKLCRDLTKQEEKQIEEKVQQMYESKELLGKRLSNGRSCSIPQMWVTSFNQKGKMEEQELDEEIILTIMYPFLDISKKTAEQTAVGKTMPDTDDVEL